MFSQVSVSHCFHRVGIPGPTSLGGISGPKSLLSEYAWSQVPSGDEWVGGYVQEGWICPDMSLDMGPGGGYPPPPPAHGTWATPSPTADT